MANATVSYLWRDQKAHQNFRTGISLHSHTNQSRETLDFLANLGSKYAMIRPFLARLERRAQKLHGVRIDYASSYWTPPLTPKLAFELESKQIELLGLDSMVSITDHDNIEAPMLLKAVPSARHIPVSVEWSVPYGGVQDFHIGVHNLPSASAKQWMATLAAYTSNPREERLKEILLGLNEEPNVLIVFNHPMWDLFLIGEERHRFMVNEFLQKFGAWLHALELNGLRNWEENRETRRLAERWNMILVSGGDRHGVEPNANINLTNATTFTEFVHEIRRERRSNVLFMPQYAQPWKHRLLKSTLDAIRNYPEFPQGSRTWDERAHHPDADGLVRPLSEIWPKGRAPLAIQFAVRSVQMLGSRPVSGGLRMAWSESNQLRLALSDQEG
ncbi:MAG: hypothetical protein JST28_02900 [Acidobacteria bacterium]|nr:hypothetical protein [Acidobacteriota bacterium]